MSKKKIIYVLFTMLILLGLVQIIQAQAPVGCYSAGGLFCYGNQCWFGGDVMNGCNEVYCDNWDGTPMPSSVCSTSP